MKPLFLLFITMLLSFPVGIRAQDAQDQEKMGAIRELLKITGVEASREEWSRAFSQQIISVLEANGNRVDERTVAIIEDEVEKVVREQLEQEVLQKKMYTIYARYFTLEEIYGLIEFNQSPLGIKANRVMPVLMRESLSAAQDWSVEIGPELSERVRRRLAREGISTGQ